jgi:hypothetical protein
MVVMGVPPVLVAPGAAVRPVVRGRPAVTRGLVAPGVLVVLGVRRARRAGIRAPLMVSPAMVVMVGLVARRVLPVPAVPVSPGPTAPVTLVTAVSVALVVPAVAALAVARRVRAGPLGVRALSVVLTASPVGLPLVPGVALVVAAVRVSTPRV